MKIMTEHIPEQVIPAHDIVTELFKFDELDKDIRECQDKRDELLFAIRASRRAINFWRSELRRIKHNNTEHNN